MVRVRSGFFGTILLLVAFSLQSFLSAQVISVNFAGDVAGGGLNFVVPTDVAGVVPVANWNNTDNTGAGVLDGSLSNLVDDSGSATTAGVTWGGSNNLWGGVEGLPGVTTGDEWMINGWLDDNGDGATVNVTGIPYEGYDVYVYGNSDSGNGGNGLNTVVNGVKYYSGGEYLAENETIDMTFFGDNTVTKPTGALGHVDASTTDPDPSFFKITGLSGSTLEIFGQNDGAGPVLPGGGTRYRGVISGFQIVENNNPDPRVEINRDTGEVTIVNPGSAFDLTGYSLTSTAGSLDEDGWISVTGNYDSAGDGSVSSDAWTILSSSNTELGESTLGGGTLQPSQSVTLGIAWRSSPFEDVGFELLDASGNTLTPSVVYTGNGGESFAEGDFNGDGAIDTLDWPTVRDGFNSSLAGATAVDAYLSGDLTGDSVVDIADLVRFESLFDEANGAGAFAQAVPEPGSVVLFGLGGLMLLGLRRRNIRSVTSLCLMGLVLLASQTNSVDAQSIGISFDSDREDATFDTGELAGIVPQANWNTAGFLPADAAVFTPGDTSAITSPNAGMITDSTGATLPGVTVNWSANNSWSTDNGISNGDNKLLNGYLDNSGANPQVTLDIAGLPAANVYDAYVYFGSDGNDRTGSVSDGTNRFSYSTFSQQAGTFPGSYTLTTDVCPDASDVTCAGGNFPQANYAVFTGLSGGSVSITVDRGSSNSGIHGIQLVPGGGSVPLNLDIDLASGGGTIENPGTVAADIDYYEIASADGSINLGGWNSLEDQDFEGNGAPGSGNGWEELGNLDSNLLAEFYLTGSSVFAGGDTVDLGSLFAGGSQDLEFRYKSESGLNQVGTVTYSGEVGGLLCDLTGAAGCDINDIDALYAGGVTNAEIQTWLTQASSAANPLKADPAHTYVPGDINLDGSVNSTDLGLLLNNFNDDSGLGWGSGNLNDDANVDATDLGLLLNNFNFSSASAQAVPEPSSMLLVLAAFASLLGITRRKR